MIQNTEFIRLHTLTVTASRIQFEKPSFSCH